MEERLLKTLQSLASGRDLGLVNDQLQQLLPPASTLWQGDYTEARASGLTISEAQFAATVAAALCAFGLEGLISRLEQSASPKRTQKLARKRRKPREDSDLNKKTKF